MLPGFDPTHLLATCGYWAVLLFVAVESMGVPIPGETMLLLAAGYAGATGHLSIGLVIVAASGGALLGDNLGYLIGRTAGSRLLRRYGRYVGLNERKLLVGQYLFRRHGGKAVFLGRFVAVLRVFAAVLAGTNGMPWRRFLLCNAAGGLLWATTMGLLGYLLGTGIDGPLGLASLALGALLLVGGVIVLRRNERRWEREAELELRDGAARDDVAA